MRNWQKTLKTTALTLSTTVALIACSGVAMAADQGAAGAIKGEILPPVKQGLPAMLASFATFLIVLAIMAKLVWPKILGGINDRSNKIKEEIEAAEMARQQAKDALEQYQQSLSQARAEAQKEIDKARSQAQIIANELRQKADVELNAMREKAMKDIEQAKRSAVNEVYAQSAVLASQMASRILKRDVQPGDTQRLLDESLQHMGAMRN